MVKTRMLFLRIRLRILLTALVAAAIAALPACRSAVGGDSDPYRAAPVRPLPGFDPIALTVSYTTRVSRMRFEYGGRAFSFVPDLWLYSVERAETFRWGGEDFLLIDGPRASQATDVGWSRLDVLHLAEDGPVRIGTLTGHYYSFDVHGRVWHYSGSYTLEVENDLQSSRVRLEVRMCGWLDESPEADEAERVWVFHDDLPLACVVETIAALERAFKDGYRAAHDDLSILGRDEQGRAQPDPTPDRQPGLPGH